MKLIYIAGRFVGINNAEIQQNINAAVQASRHIQLLYPNELCPVCPHANFGGLESMGACTQDQIMNMCIALLDKCNAILMLPGWEDSRGAVRERDYAEEKGIHRFYCEEIGHIPANEIHAWLECYWNGLFGDRNPIN